MSPDPFARFARLWQVTRGPASFVLGTAIIVFEMVARRPADVELLVVAGGLVGLPLFTSTPGPP